MELQKTGVFKLWEASEFGRLCSEFGASENPKLKFSKREQRKNKEKTKKKQRENKERKGDSKILFHLTPEKITLKILF